MTDKELLQEALYALTYVGDKEIYSDIIDALRARLAQPEPDYEAEFIKDWNEGKVRRVPEKKQEPVAWRFYDGNMWCYVDHLTDLPQDKFEPLYTAPPKKKWIGLTEQERNDIEDYCQMMIGKSAFEIIEAKLKEKNSG